MNKREGETQDWRQEGKDWRGGKPGKKSSFVYLPHILHRKFYLPMRVLRIYLPLWQKHNITAPINPPYLFKCQWRTHQKKLNSNLFNRLIQ